MATDQNFLAGYLGRAWGLSAAEKYRSDLGTFVIPCPEGSTAMERPFGMLLTGHRTLDFQRVHVRIAAVQAGLVVDITNHGNIICISPPLNPLQFLIMQLAYKLEGYGRKIQREHGMALCAKFIPWGFRTDDWASADRVQKLIERTFSEEDDMTTVIGLEDGNVSVQKQEQETGNAEDAEDVEDIKDADVNFNDWLEDWVTKDDTVDSNCEEEKTGFNI